MGRLAQGQQVSQDLIPGPHGTVPIRVYPAAAPRAALLWLHGGGFIAGDLDMPEAKWVASMLAERGVTVVTATYRLCVDGVHYPVPADDVLAAFEECRTRSNSLGVTPERWSIGGASAGGMLAAVAALRLRDAGDLLPASVVLCYPMVSDVLREPDADLAVALENLSPELDAMNAAIPDMIAAYLGTSASPDPHAIPANADLIGFPRTLVINAEVDVLRPAGEDFAASLEKAGCRTTLIAEPGTPHGYLNAPGHPAATATIARIAQWLTTAAA